MFHLSFLIVSPEVMSGTFRIKLLKTVCVLKVSPVAQHVEKSFDICEMIMNHRNESNPHTYVNPLVFCALVIFLHPFLL